MCLSVHLSIFPPILPAITCHVQPVTGTLRKEIHSTNSLESMFTLKGILQISSTVYYFFWSVQFLHQSLSQASRKPWKYNCMTSVGSSWKHTFHFLRAANFLNFSIFTADSFLLSACCVSFGWNRWGDGGQTMRFNTRKSFPFQNYFHTTNKWLNTQTTQTLIQGCWRLSWIVILFLQGKVRQTVRIVLFTFAVCIRKTKCSGQVVFKKNKNNTDFGF